MVHHMVMWKLNDSFQRNERTAIGSEMKERLLGLKEKISVIKNIEVGINGAYPERNHDILLYCTFDSFADLEVYVNHPEHIKVVEFVRKVTHNRTAVDFEN